MIWPVAAMEVSVVEELARRREMTPEQLRYHLADRILSSKVEQLDIKFGVVERLKFAWRAFRYPHAVRNTLHFTQEAMDSMDAIVTGELAQTHSAVELAFDARSDLEFVIELLKLLQDYED